MRADEDPRLRLAPVPMGNAGVSRSLHSLRGAARLGFDCIGGMMGRVEQLHATVAHHPPPWAPLPDGRPRSCGRVSSAVYALLRVGNAALQEGVDRSLCALAEALDAKSGSTTHSRLASVLNGICGDHLEATGNALAIPMSFRSPAARLEPTREALSRALPDATPRVVVLVHGLCLSERDWSRRRRPGIGERLREALGYTPVYLRYNSGRHISANGRELADQLERLVAAWPLPLESLALVGHSMGGLVIRSACGYAERDARAWLGKLRRVAFLGTPHHGCPLEKGGQGVTLAMRASPYAEPLALGTLRSAGVKDLRYGNLLDEDWQGRDPDRPGGDSRRPLPLPEGVEHYFVAASVGRDEFDLRGRLLGDLLVRAGSAVGAHGDAVRRLPALSQHCLVLHGRHHLDLLSDPAVPEQLVEWFETAPAAAPPDGEPEGAARLDSADSL